MCARLSLTMCPNTSTNTRQVLRRDVEGLPLARPSCLPEIYSEKTLLIESIPLTPRFCVHVTSVDLHLVELGFLFRGARESNNRYYLLDSHIVIGGQSIVFYCLIFNSVVQEYSLRHHTHDMFFLIDSVTREAHSYCTLFSCFKPTALLFALF